MKTNLTQKQNEHLWQLMYEKIAGIIHPKDLRYLEEQLRKDDSMQEAFQALEYALNEEESIDLERLKRDEDWRDLLSIIKANPKARPSTFTRFEKVAMAAMIAGLLLSSAGYYYYSQRQITQAQQLAAIRDEKNVMLLLADNRSIPLPEQQHLVNLGDVQLHNDNHALTFSGATGHSEQHTLIVPVAKDYKVTLSDGTEIWLNAATRIRFPFNFNGNSREITLLSGEAYVNVAGNAAQPFIVHTPNSTVQVLGTAFNINVYEPGMVRLSLVNGAVRMKAGTTAVVVKPGMEAIYTGDKGLYTQPFDVKEVLSWRSGKHYFINAPMLEICTILSRNLNLNAVIDSGSLAHTKHFSGVVNKNKPVQEFLEDVKNTTEIDYYFDKQGVLHFR